LEFIDVSADELLTEDQWGSTSSDDINTRSSEWEWSSEWSTTNDRSAHGDWTTNNTTEYWSTGDTDAGTVDSRTAEDWTSNECWSTNEGLTSDEASLGTET